MFVKTENNELVNLNNTLSISVDLSLGIHNVLAHCLGDNYLHKVLFSGTNEQCQAYMTELEKELAAFGKLIKVEVKPETKCTCGNDGKPVWEPAENCPVYAPF